MKLVPAEPPVLLDDRRRLTVCTRHAQGALLFIGDEFELDSADRVGEAIRGSAAFARIRTSLAVDDEAEDRFRRGNASDSFV
ncbi:MAG: hypothetical protein ACOCZB_03725 [Spirochaetota bacterium]